MNQQQTLFPQGPIPSTGRPVSRSTFELLPELLEKARGRVMRVALIMLALNVFGMVASISYGASEGFGWEDVTWVVVSTVNALFCAAVVAASRSDRFSHRAVLNLGLALEVVLCFGGSLTTTSLWLRETGALPYMTWAIPLIILFPMIVPCTPRRILTVSILAAAMEPLAAVVVWVLSSVPTEIMLANSGGYIINPGLAVFIAYFASRIVYGLNVDVSKAQRLGSYQLDSLLGRGGMGEVWHATHHLLARPAAIKLIRPDALGGTIEQARTPLKRFKAEAHATANLNSPHTIGIYDFGVSEDGTFYYVMELLHGLDLNSLVGKHGTLSPERVVHFLKQACHSLREAHDAGLVHRDIKPSNIFVCRYGSDNDFIKILDFGLVKERSASTTETNGLTQKGMVVGTPGFMAPEVAVGGAPADGRADLYALGCVAYWLLTGCLVFEAETPMALVVKHVSEAPEPPSNRTEQTIPSSLEEIILCCLEKDPNDRPQTAQALADRLEECVLDSEWTPEQAKKWWDLHYPRKTDGSPHTSNKTEPAPALALLDTVKAEPVVPKSQR